MTRSSTGEPAAPAVVRLLVNGEPHATAAVTLADLVVELGHGGARVATALNGDFVPERSRPAARIKPGDRVEIVSPRQGG